MTQIKLIKITTGVNIHSGINVLFPYSIIVLFIAYEIKYPLVPIHKVSKYYRLTLFIGQVT